ncbi:hypothetical protein [Peijinzhouia sedimentorum]
MARKNKILTFILVLLVFANIIFWLNPFSSNQSNQANMQFAVADTAAITHIRLTKNDTTIVLSEQEGVWKVDDRWPIEKSWEVNLKAILLRQQVRRTLGESEVELLKDEVSNWVNVEVYNGDELIQAFKAGGNATRTQSLIEAGGEIYATFVPGYDSYLTSIYELGPYEWRDRTLYRGTEGSLRTFTVTAIKQDLANSFTIAYEAGAFRSKENGELDEEEIRNFMRNLNGLYADVWVPYNQNEKVQQYLTMPMAELTLDDLSEEKSIQLKFYDLPEDPRFYLGEILGEEDYFLISRPRLLPILHGPSN